jgi:hypothetical protein
MLEPHAKIQTDAGMYITDQPRTDEQIRPRMIVILGKFPKLGKLAKSIESNRVSRGGHECAQPDLLGEEDLK